jgi:hypothetical protein
MIWTSDDEIQEPGNVSVTHFGLKAQVPLAPLERGHPATAPLLWTRFVAYNRFVINGTGTCAGIILTKEGIKPRPWKADHLRRPLARGIRGSGVCQLGSAWRRIRRARDRSCAGHEGPPSTGAGEEDPFFYADEEETRSPSPLGIHSDPSNRLQYSITGWQPGPSASGIAPIKTIRFRYAILTFALGYLHADPGGPYTVTRGGTVPVDGSGSTPSAKIKSYRWTFSSEQCPDQLQKEAVKSGKRVRVDVLCTMRAKLTVSDGRREASHSTTVTVVARDWRTDVRLVGVLNQGGGFPLWEPRQVGAKTLTGVNVTSCLEPNPSPAWATPEKICPLYSVHHTWYRHGYTLAQVDDHNSRRREHGPFDGDRYVASSTLSIDRDALLNP